MIKAPGRCRSRTVHGRLPRGRCEAVGRSGPGKSTLLDSRTALRNVAHPLQIAGVPQAERLAKARELLHSPEAKQFIEDKWSDGSVLPSF